MDRRDPRKRDRVYVLVGKIVKDEDFTEEREHRDILYNAANESVAGHELLVLVVCLAVKPNNNEATGQDASWIRE
jgi:hypothetical protein